MTLPPPSAPGDPVVPLISRRRLLIGSAGSLVAVAGGIAVVSTSRTPPSADLSTATVGTVPVTGVPAAGVPATTVPVTAVPVTTVPGAGVVSDRILVVLQLGGGNDALNTLVPVTGSYHDARPSLALVDDELVRLPFTEAYGLHPALAALGPLLADGQVGVVAGIGFDQPDRSHFKAFDMWWSAAPGETFRTGWLGRWLDAAGAGPPMRSISLGGSVPALRADVARSIAVNELDQFALLDSDSAADLIDAWTGLGPDQADARSAIETFAGLTLPADLGDAEPATERLLAAAQLIASDPQVRLVHVALTGFDTHSNQRASHQALLADVASGIARFQSAIEASGHADRVLLITTSEFGRRVVENGSGGTDHGKAGVQFVIGRGVTTPSVFGAIDLADLADGDLRPVIDPRSLYATALDWLDGERASARTDAVLGASYERLPFL